MKTVALVVGSALCGAVTLALGVWGYIVWTYFVRRPRRHNG